MPPFTRQTDEPLYPKALWNRPVARSAGGRILIAGGHRSDFSLPTAAYQMAMAAGVGQATVALPDVLRPLLAGAPDVEFLPSSPSGSLGRAALGQLVELAGDSGAAVLAGLSNNSETTILAEGLVRETHRSAIVVGEAAETLKHVLADLAAAPDTLFILSLSQLFKLANALELPTRVARTDLAGRLEIIETIAAACRASFLIHGQELVAATAGQLILTEAAELPEAALAGTAAAFWVQNPDHPVALATACYVLRRATGNAGSLPVTELAKAVRGVLAEF